MRYEFRNKGLFRLAENNYFVFKFNKDYYYGLQDCTIKVTD